MQSQRQVILCPIEDIDPEHGREVQVEVSGRSEGLALFRLGERVVAYRNICPHQGRALSWAPGEFLCEPDGSLVCPHHGARFELVTGRCIAGPCAGSSLSEVAIRLENGMVWLES